MADNTGNNTGGKGNLLPPWQPGESGNPAGRPKGAVGFARRIAEGTDDGATLYAAAMKLVGDSKHKDHFRAIMWLEQKMNGRVVLETELARELLAPDADQMTAEEVEQKLNAIGWVRKEAANDSH